jgi:hypothetical protein
MAATFPPGDPRGVTIVGSNTFTANEVTTYDLTFEYEYSIAWLLTNVVLQKRNGQTNVLGLHVTPMKQSLKELNRFTFEGKGAFHYLVFALTVGIPLFIVFALVLCVRTPIGKRKWRWLLFVTFGFVQFSFNWTDGSYAIQPITFAIFGAGFFRAGPYAPFVLTVALPVGAIVFLLRRRSLAARSEPSISAPLS